MAKINAVDNKMGELTVDNGTGNTSKILLDINSVSKYSVGVPDDSVDRLYISVGSSPGSSNTMTIEPSGEVRMGMTSAVSARTDNFNYNVTGDGTSYSPIGTTIEVFDQNSDFASSTFTAPKTGKYLLKASYWFNGLTSGHTGYLEIVTSNRTYRSFNLKHGVSPSGSWGTISVLADMDASDTAITRTAISGGARVIDVGYSLGADTRSQLGAFLVC